ncbi:MAG: CBS domain-containing protein [Deltaproteobacteria bacterium]|nr:CBS domain-containing protein [Deltaproteobacteria bacterium]
MDVRDVMSPNPTCCKPDTSVPEVAELMEQHDCGAIPVIDELGVPKGIITDRDLAMRVIAKGKPAGELKARDVMTPVTVTLKPHEPASEASKLMAKHRIRRLLVVDQGGKCVGMVSLADLSRACPAEEMGRLVKKISEPIEEPAKL